MRTIDQLSDEERVKLEARASSVGNGVTAQDVLSADETNMSPLAYVRFRDVRSLDEYESVRATEAVEAEAQRQALVERAREALPLMAWVDPPTMRVGVAPTSDDFNDVSGALSFLHGPPSVLLTRIGAGQTVANGNEFDLIWGGSLIDTDSMFQTSTRIVFNTAGVYLVGFTAVLWVGNVTGVRNVRFRMPNVKWQHRVADPGAAIDCVMSASGMARAVVSDEAAVGVFQSSGGNLDIQPDHLTFAHWIGG